MILEGKVTAGLPFEKVYTMHTESGFYNPKNVKTNKNAKEHNKHIGKTSPTNRDVSGAEGAATKDDVVYLKDWQYCQPKQILKHWIKRGK